MPCKIQLRKRINDNIEARTNDAFNKSLLVANKIADAVNKDYKTQVVKFSETASKELVRDITIPDSLVQTYYDSELRIEEQEARLPLMADARRAGIDYTDDYMFQVSSVKEGVQDVFDSNPELSSIGSPEQYSAYLDTIFPDSKVKDIVYHTTFQEFKGDKFNKPSEKSLIKGADDGIYFSKNANYYTNEGNKIASILDLKNPMRYSHGVFMSAIDASGYRQVEGSDGFITYLKEYEADLNPIKPQLPDIDPDDFSKEELEEIKNNYKKELDVWKSLADKEELVFATVFEPEQIHILGSKQDVEGFKKFIGSNVNAQIKGSETGQLSKESIDKVKAVIEKMGVSIEALSDYAKSVGLDIKGINGVADLTRKIIAIAEGKEAGAITEEMVHIATAILEQKNPQLITQLISKIDKFKIYNKTLKEYRDNKNYQLPDGRPDIRKIKKEAVDKLIAELIVNKLENITAVPELEEAENLNLVQRMWQTILDAIKSLYRKADIDLFQDVANTIMEQEVGTLGDNHGMGTFYQVISDAQQNVLNNLENTKKTITKKIEKVEKADPNLLDDDEASNYYERKNVDGSVAKVVNRVTDRVKAWYQKKFPNRQFSETEQVINDIKRRYGVKGHADFEGIHNRFFNPDGTKREVPLDRPEKPNVGSFEIYQLLEDYFVELIDTFPENTLFLAEQMIYDEEQDEAGTIDFLAILPDGTGKVLDWKFMSPGKNQIDIPIYKQGGFGIQLNRYKEILTSKYGLVDVIEKKAIPIAMDIEFIRGKEAKLNGIAIGSVDPRKITTPFLIPVTDEDISTGYDELDKLLKKVKALISQVEKEDATDEEERSSKIERLNALRSAIRIVQGTNNLYPLIEVVESMGRDGNRIFNNYEVNFKDRPATSLDSTNKELSEISDEMVTFIKTAELFQNLGADIGHLIYTKEMEADATTEEELEVLSKRKEILDKMNDAALGLYKTRQNMIDAHLAFANKHIGERNQTTGLLNAEKVLKGLSSLFRGLSDLPLKSLQLLFKITRAAQGKASADSLNQVKKLMDIRKRLMDRGGDVRNTVNKIYQKDDDGKSVNKLIHKYSKDFYEEVDKQAAEGGNIKWLMENVDLDAYNVEVKKLVQERTTKIHQNYGYDSTLSDDENVEAGNLIEEQLDKMYYAIEDVKQQFLINYPSFTGYNNYVLKRHPKDKWLSKEYLEITKDKDLLDLYNFIIDINETANQTGYISNIVRSTFLPFIRKSMAEQLAIDGPISAIANFNKNVKDSLSIKADDTGYGKINEVTGELENGIPKYYTYDFTKLPNGVNDYSEVSEDIFRNMILYLQQVNKYKYLSEVEGQLNLIKSVEKFKDAHLRTNHINQVVLENGKPVTEKGNAENTKMYDDFLRVLLYDQKYVLSDEDVPLHVDKILNFVKKAVNTVAGKEIWAPNETASPTSMIKTIDAMNRGFQLKTLGFEFISGAVNAFGGNIQLATQAGNYFKAREILANEGKILRQEFKNDADKDVFIELINTFMPMKDDPSYEELKKAGISKLTRANLGDMLMFFMRYPEQVIEKSIFLTLLDNSIIEDGKIVNINEFVRSKYKNRYDSASSYKQSSVEMEKEIEELKKRSISKIAKLENGKLSIEGLDLENQKEIQRMTDLSRRISRNATGGLSDGDINRMSMSIWTRSMMVFKNWIPKLLDTRFSEFRKVSDDFSVTINEDGIAEGQKYDIGRIRLFGKVLVDSLTSAEFQLKNILEVNDKGIEYLDKLLLEFAEEYKKETGEDLVIDRDQFFDLIKNNLRRQIQELAILGSLFGMMLALGFVAPDDDDDKATKNFYRFSQRVVDKFTNELMFFYNPVEFQKLLSGGMFPALGLTNDFLRFSNHFFSEVTGRAIDDEEMTKKAQPIKNVMKMLPVTKSMVTYLAILNEDFAKEFDVTIQKENSIR